MGNRLERKDLRRGGWMAALGLALFLLFMVLALRQLDPSTTLHLWQASQGMLIWLLGLSLLNYLLRWLRWELFSHRLGINLRWRRSLLYYLAGFSMTTTPGRIGELLRLWLLRKQHGITLHRSLPLAAGDRMGDLYSMLALCVLSAALLGHNAGLVAAVITALSLLTLLLLNPAWLLAVVDTGYRLIRRWPRLFASARHMLRQLRQLIQWPIAVPTLLLSLAGWLAECAGLYLLLHAFGTPLSMVHCVFAFTLAMTAGGVSMLPGGLGAAEATLVAILMGFGIAAEAAVLCAAIIRLATLWFAVAIGMLCLPIALFLQPDRYGNTMKRQPEPNP